MSIPVRADLVKNGSSAFGAGSGYTPPWFGKLYGITGDCDPDMQWRQVAMNGVVAATPTNIGTSVARLSYFRPPAAIAINKLQFYGVGATSGVYQFAIYSVSGNTLTRVGVASSLTTGANLWSTVSFGAPINLSANTLYAAAVAVNATGTTPGIACMGPTDAATTGNIAPRLDDWPNGLQGALGFFSSGFAQAAVTSGVLAASLTVSATKAAWTGGMPAIWLDNN